MYYIRVTKSLIYPKSFHTKSRHQFCWTHEIHQHSQKLSKSLGKICRRRKKSLKRMEINLTSDSKCSRDSHSLQYRTNSCEQSWLKSKTHTQAHSQKWVPPCIPEHWCTHSRTVHAPNACSSARAVGNRKTARGEQAESRGVELAGGGNLHKHTPRAREVVHR